MDAGAASPETENDRTSGQAAGATPPAARSETSGTGGGTSAALIDAPAAGRAYPMRSWKAAGAGLSAAR